MKIDAIIGLQWGDEGKGKIVDFLAPQYDLVCRFQGGPNAGHTLKINGQRFVLHTIPSGIFHDHLINIIGNGVVLDPITLERELHKLDDLNIDYHPRLWVARKAHLILPTHRWLDAASEAYKGVAKIGSTLRGIGPTYMDKTGRNGLRVGDLNLSGFNDKYQALKEKHLGLLKLYPEIPFDLAQEEEKWFNSIRTLQGLKDIDTEYVVYEALGDGKRLLAEGAQGSMLDVDFGTYPYVTSSNTIASGICNGLGVAPKHIGKIIGIAKAYCTRVGSGPFPTELLDEEGEKLRQAGVEFGSTTGRPRRCGWIDLPQLKYTIMLNGVDTIALTKIDVLDHFETIQAGVAYRRHDGEITTQVPFDLEAGITPLWETLPGWNTDISSCRHRKDFPPALNNYLTYLERQLKTPIGLVSTGPEREKLIVD